MLLTLFVLAGCTQPHPEGPSAARSDTRQVPTVTEPGLHIGGYVNAGVVRTF